MIRDLEDKGASGTQEVKLRIISGSDNKGPTSGTPSKSMFENSQEMLVMAIVVVVGLSFLTKHTGVPGQYGPAGTSALSGVGGLLGMMAQWGMYLLATPGILLIAVLCQNSIFRYGFPLGWIGFLPGWSDTNRRRLIKYGSIGGWIDMAAEGKKYIKKFTENIEELRKINPELSEEFKRAQMKVVADNFSQLTQQHVELKNIEGKLNLTVEEKEAFFNHIVEKQKQLTIDDIKSVSVSDQAKEFARSNFPDLEKYLNEVIKVGASEQVLVIQQVEDTTKFASSSFEEVLKIYPINFVKLHDTLKLPEFTINKTMYERLIEKPIIPEKISGKDKTFQERQRLDANRIKRALKDSKIREPLVSFKEVTKQLARKV
jgi:hypothetical protein